jgi:hypothetical protein
MVNNLRCSLKLSYPINTLIWVWAELTIYGKLARNPPEP